MHLQHLPRSCMQLCLRVRQFLRRYIPESASLVLAFSGGADSTALARILHALDYRIGIAHLDHSIRSASAEEALAAEHFAQSMHIPCIVQQIDVPALAQDRHCSLEAAGRFARYRFLEEVRSAWHAEWIATGHQLDDLCEDQIMRYLRGTGWPAMGGMPAFDKDRHLIRPLLAVSRKEIESFLQLLNVSWKEDASNRDLHFTRNRMRQKAVPFFRAENPSFSASVLNLWQLAQADAAYWQEQLAPILDTMRTLPLPEYLVQSQHLRKVPHAGTPALYLAREFFLDLPQAVRLRLYFAMIKEGIRMTHAGQARADTLFRLDAALCGERRTRYFPLPGGLLLISSTTGIWLPLAEKKHNS